MLANTNTAASANPPDGSELARELRRAMVELNGASEEANELVCVVEDSFGLDYPATGGRAPDRGGTGHGRGRAAGNTEFPGRAGEPDARGAVARGQGPAGFGQDGEGGSGITPTIGGHHATA
jgi:hypothetical protein